jgi:hypothetical protein
MRVITQAQLNQRDFASTRDVTGGRRVIRIMSELFEPIIESDDSPRLVGHANCVFPREWKNSRLTEGSLQ